MEGCLVMFCKDNRTENFLTQMGMEFIYSNRIEFHQLLTDWDKRNLSRPVAVRDDAVLEYSTLMQSGSAAPAPVLLSVGSEYDVLDGVQRLVAAQLAGTTTISAYVVTCDSSKMVSAIKVLSNARLQGRPEPPEWTRRRAVEVLILQQGMSVEEVARMGGWKPSQVESTAKSIDWAHIITGIGGPELPDSMIQVISDVTTRDELLSSPAVIGEMLKTIKQSKLSASDAAPYLQAFFAPVAKSSRRHEIYTQRLMNICHEPEIQSRINGRKGYQVTLDIQLRRALKTAITVVDEMEIDRYKLLNVDEFFKLLNDLQEKLHKMSNRKRARVAKVPADLWKHDQ